MEALSHLTQLFGYVLTVAGLCAVQNQHRSVWEVGHLDRDVMFYVSHSGLLPLEQKSAADSEGDSTMSTP